MQKHNFDQNLKLQTVTKIYSSGQLSVQTLLNLVTTI